MELPKNRCSTVIEDLLLLSASRYAQPSATGDHRVSVRLVSLDRRQNIQRMGLENIPVF